MKKKMLNQKVAAQNPSEKIEVVKPKPLFSDFQNN
jgi:hypothetical protein